MNFQLIPIGEVLGKTIHHGILHLSFEDYDDFFLKLRGKKPQWLEAYTASQERWHDYMLGFDFHWDDGTVERLSFKDFWNLLDRNWDWGERKETLGGYRDNEGKWHPKYSVLSLTYTEIVFQTHSSGCCTFDRMHERVTGHLQDINRMKDYVKRFNEGLRL